MTRQVVNTVRIAASASRLRTANSNINNAFTTLRNKARQLDNSWKSAAGDTARQTMHSLFQNSDVRSQVIMNYVNILQQQVDPGYVNAENTNVKLADKFK